MRSVCAPAGRRRRDRLRGAGRLRAGRLYTTGFVNTPPLLTIPIERPAQFSWQRFEYLGNIIDDPCNSPVHADTDVTYKALWKELPWADK